MLMLSPQVTVGDGEVPGGKSSKVCSSNASFLEQRLVDLGRSRDDVDGA